jgi:hypothetical protein
MNARARAKEVANKLKELELALLTKEAKIMTTPITDNMDPIQQAWLEKKKMMIHGRDVGFTRSNLCLIPLDRCDMLTRPDQTSL